jgi:hypothetical protein
MIPLPLTVGQFGQRKIELQKRTATKKHSLCGEKPYKRKVPPDNAGGPDDP